MIKITLITLISAGVIGTGAQTLTPQTLDIAAGAMVVQLSSDGVNIDAAASPDFAVTLTTKGNRAFTVRF